MFKILREVQLNVGVKKVDIYKGVLVKALLDSGTTEMFMDWKMAAKHGFRLQKLKRPIVIRNVDRTNNSAEAITHQVKVKLEQLEVQRTEEVKVIIEEVDLLEKVKQSRVKDDEVIKAVEEIKRAGVKMLRDEEWREVDGIIYKEGKVYVPKDNVLRMEIIRLYHDTPVEGHEGQQKTVELVTRNFWWSGITKEVKKYVEEYNFCQRNKNCIKQLAGKLMPNFILEKPWTHISADFITKLPLAQGYDSILVVVDQLTKIVYFILTTERTSAKELARLFRDNM